MYRADYHTHCRFSYDCQAELLDMALAAERAGLSEMAVTDHCDMHLPFDHQGQYDEVMRVRALMAGRVKILYGLEMGEQIHNLPKTRAILADWPLDFIIGSYHIMRKHPDFYDMDYTDMTPERAHGLIREYLAELWELSRDGDFDVLGHLTYPLRYMYRRNPAALSAVSFAPYTDELTAIFRTLVQRGRGIELNLSCAFDELPLLMPDIPVLKLYRACGGEIITLGNDAHGTEYIGRGQAIGVAALREAGFTHTAAYEERRLRFEPL